MWLHQDLADGSADMLRTRAATTNRLRYRVLGSYTNGASFATVVAATIGYVALTAADITSATSGTTRQHTLASKTIPLTAGDDGAGMNWAITDETDSKVLMANTGTPSATPVASGGSLNMPSFVFASTAMSA